MNHLLAGAFGSVHGFWFSNWLAFYISLTNIFAASLSACNCAKSLGFIYHFLHLVHAFEDWINLCSSPSPEVALSSAKDAHFLSERASLLDKKTLLIVRFILDIDIE